MRTSAGLSEKPEIQNNGFLDRLRKVVGAGGVLDAARDRELYSQDLSFNPMANALAVVRPQTVEHLAEVVSLGTGAGFAVVARGGGMSYSNGYTPLHGQSLIVDFRALDRIREIDLEDMFVVVECGCTWMKLQEALHARGVRTPYYGPVSGMWATVGGVLSNNSFFMGAETAGDTLLGLHVVLANGEILRTGSDALSGRKPFFRQFGPDITGLFVGDAGAYGFKAVAILRLVPLAGATKFLSFKFTNAKAMLGAQVAVSRLGVACECFGFDPAKNEHFAQQSVGIAEGAGILRKLIARNGFWRGFRQAAQVAIHGRRFMQHVRYSAHMTIDGIDSASARAAEKAARKVCLRSGGTEIPNTFPAVFRSEPFSDLKGHMVGPNGEVWLSLSGFFAYSQIAVAVDAAEAWCTANRDMLERHGIHVSYLTVFQGGGGQIDMNISWSDAVEPLRSAMMDKETREKWAGGQANLEARRVALETRKTLRDLFDAHGACHIQIGKYYLYGESIAPAHWTLLTEIKKALDPLTLVNPGAIGLQKHN